MSFSIAGSTNNPDVSQAAYESLAEVVKQGTEFDSGVFADDDLHFDALDELEEAGLVESDPDGQIVATQAGKDAYAAWRERQ